MIISDGRRFVFVHIPKCGGTSVRKLLIPYKSPHEGLGGAVGDHRPLYSLERDHPVIWGKLTRYSSFAIVRRPESRFFSCVMQRLIDFSDIANPTVAEYRRACAADAAFLAQNPDSRDWPDEYVHFIPQTEYVFCGDRQIVRCIFPLERPDDLLAHLSTELGVDTCDGLTRERRSTGARHGSLRGPARWVGAALRPVLSSARFEPVKSVFKRIVTTAFSAERALGPSEHAHYATFAREFYAADYQLWRDSLQCLDPEATMV